MAGLLEIATVLTPSVSVFSGRRGARIVCDAAPQVSLDNAHEGVTSRSFGRLKLQRIRDLVKESHKKKKLSDDLVGDQQKAETAPSCVPHVLSKESNLLDEQSYYSIGGIKVDTSNVSKSNFQSARRDAPSSKVPVAFSKRWNNVEPTYNNRSRVYGTSKKEQNLKASNDFFSRKSFKELGYSDSIIESLKKLQYVRPSHIQVVQNSILNLSCSLDGLVVIMPRRIACFGTLAFTPVIRGKSCIVADQSGSGKTLAYLVPLVQRLRQEELEGLGKPASQNPRVIILVPTTELASQVLNNCRSLSKAGVPFRSMVATGGFRQRTQLESLRQELDVLIVTPGRFLFLVKEGFLQLANLKSVVLDEVDILYNDEDFELALQSLVNSAPVTSQYLFVTATLPVEIYNKLVEVFPDCEVAMGPGMHRTSPGLEEILVDCCGDDKMEKTPDTAFQNKKNALLKIVEQSPVTKTIIFCNKIETCRKVENALKRFDRKEICTKVLPFHSALEQESRLANIKEFRSFQSENVSMFLVCTDRASRGIDFADVDHVVLFDFPRDPSEYVRRVGRTARGAGGRGKAFVFVVGKQVSLARRIIERNIKGHPLHDVPSAYEVMK